MAPAEGWYPDPAHRFRQRWWTGEEWLDQVVGDGLRIRRDPAKPSWPPPASAWVGEARQRLDLPETGPRWCADPDDQRRLRWWDGRRWTEDVAEWDGHAWATRAASKAWTLPPSDRRDWSRVMRIGGLGLVVLGVALEVGFWSVVVVFSDEARSSSDSTSSWWIFGPMALVVLGGGIVAAFPSRRTESRPLAQLSLILSFVMLSPVGVVVAPILGPVAITLSIRALRRANDPDGREARLAGTALIVAAVCLLLVVPMLLLIDEMARDFVI